MRTSKKLFDFPEEWKLLKKTFDYPDERGSTRASGDDREREQVPNKRGARLWRELAHHQQQNCETLKMFSAFHRIRFVRRQVGKVLTISSSPGARWWTAGVPLVQWERTIRLPDRELFTKYRSAKWFGQAACIMMMKMMKELVLTTIMVTVMTPINIIMLTQGTSAKWSGPVAGYSGLAVQGVQRLERCFFHLPFDYFHFKTEHNVDLTDGRGGSLSPARPSWRPPGEFASAGRWFCLLTIVRCIISQEIHEQHFHFSLSAFVTKLRRTKQESNRDAHPVRSFLITQRIVLLNFVKTKYDWYLTFGVPDFVQSM